MGYFSAFLQELMRRYAGSLNLLLLDSAPARVAHRVEVPENVMLVPPLP